MTRRLTLVTGASKGIGRAVAERLAREGHSIIGLAPRPPEESFPGRLVAVDLADAHASAQTLARLAAEEPIDGLVNNVGLIRPGAVGAVAVEDLAAVLDLNLRPALQAVQAVLPSMRQRRWG